MMLASRFTRMPAWASIERFDYGPLDQKWAIVRLLAALEAELAMPADPALLVHCHGSSSSHEPFATVADRREGGLAWRVSFAVPLAVVECPGALFELSAAARSSVALPHPHCFLAVPASATRLPPRRRCARRRLTALVSAVAVSTSSTGGLAVSTAIAAHGPKTAAHAIASKDRATAAAAVARLTVRPARTLALEPRVHVREPSTARPQPQPGPRRPRPQTLASLPHTPGHLGSSHPAVARAPTGGAGLTPASEPAHKHRKPHQTPPELPSTPPSLRDVPENLLPSTPAAPAQPEAASTPLTTGNGANPTAAAGLSVLSGMFVNYQGPPPFLIPIYEAAGRHYHVPWTVLAAINWVESDYGRNLNVSSAGAIGWMQFEPGTWAQYGVDWDGKDAPNPYDPHDAVLSAARYLAANGARKDLRTAIFAYNHATWYVDEVLQRAKAIGILALDARSEKGYSLPLQAKYMHQFGRTDDGLDIETAPDGAPVYSMTPGVVTAVASDPAGFGPNYPVILATRGPLIGQFIYYGHVATSLVHAGEHVGAGQPIAVMGHTGDAASLGHGHIEIGFSTAYGDPLNHHGAVAWTASGDAMHRFLIALCARFKIQVS